MGTERPDLSFAATPSRAKKPVAKLTIVAVVLTAALGAQVGLAQSIDPARDTPVDPATDTANRRATGSLQPGVRTALRWSSNVNLETELTPSGAPNPNKSSDFLLEVTPYLRAESEAARANYRIDYAIANVFRADGSQKILGRQQLNARGSYALDGEWLWLDGSGIIANTYADLFGPLSADPNTSFVNVATIRSFSLSPNIRTRIGSFADSIFRYTLQINDASANAVEQSRFVHILSGDVRGSERRARTWNWVWAGETSRRKFGTVNVDKSFTSGSLFWVPVPDLRLTGLVMFDDVNGLRARNGKTRGPGGGFAIDWNPLDRTEISAKSLRRYFGNSTVFSLKHSSRFVLANVLYSKGINESIDASIFSIDPGAVSTNQPFLNNALYREFLAQNLRFGFGIPYGSGLISNTLIQQQRLGVSLGLTGLRNTITANLNRTIRDTSLFVTSVPATGSGPRGGTGGFSGRYIGVIEIDTGSLDYRYRLDGRSNLTLSLSHIHTRAPSAGLQSMSSSVTAGFATKLTPDTEMGAGVRRSEGKTRGLTVGNFEDTTVYGTVDVRF